ncbi:MAG: hypothetical protein AB2421_14825 [Thermotaleaceae bacterium]
MASLGFGATVGFLLTFLVKFFFVVFIIALVFGLIVAAKNYIFTPEDIEAFKAPFKRKKEIQVTDKEVVQ